ncbi:hypothetical protein PVAP13_9KG264913 [Panicum virgatum]|uniref:Uncharacterized protein n=1 Tax=Panicum virgatum TaxID=38727 RepID=A0A8T0NIX1_PANVG|nr:hypothetical protein PVAP13_9KG264913 [Panicum virgatum]
MPRPPLQWLWGLTVDAPTSTALLDISSRQLRPPLEWPSGNRLCLRLPSCLSPVAAPGTGGATSPAARVAGGPRRRCLHLYSCLPPAAMPGHWSSSGGIAALASAAASHQPHAPGPGVAAGPAASPSPLQPSLAPEWPRGPWSPPKWT